MFAVAFPLSSLFALINNIFEAKVDFAKIRGCRKPDYIIRLIDLQILTLKLNIHKYTYINLPVCTL